MYTIHRKRMRELENTQLVDRRRGPAIQSEMHFREPFVCVCGGTALLKQLNTHRQTHSHLLC